MKNSNKQKERKTVLRLFTVRVLCLISPTNLVSCLHVNTVDAVKCGVINKASCVCFHPSKLC